MQASYTEWLPNTNACPDGMLRITEKSTCQSAATSLGRTFQKQVNLDYLPRGCYLAGGDQDQPPVNFNIHPDGAAASGVKPICQVEAWDACLICKL